MKTGSLKWKTLFLGGLALLVGLTLQAQAVSVSVYAFANRPLMDGLIDASWNDNEYQQISHVLTSDKSLTGEDFSGKFKISWYENTLYFLFVITDDVLVLNENEPIWLGDNINLYLDLGNEKSENYDNNDYLYHFKWGNTNYYERFDGSSLIPIGNSETGVEFAQTCDTENHQFVLEIAFHDLAALNGPATLDVFTSFGLDAGIYDCDEGDPGFFTDHLSWIDTTGYAWADPSRLGTAGFGSAVLKAARATALHRAEAQTEFRVYPTVVSRQLNIESGRKGKHALEIVDLLGNVCLSKPLEDGTGTVEVGSLVPGIYFVKLRGEEGNCGSQKILVSRR